MAGVFGEPMHGADYHRYLRIQMAKAFGWTLDDIDSLGTQDWLDALAVLHGLADLNAFARS